MDQNTPFQAHDEEQTQVEEWSMDKDEAENILGADGTDLAPAEEICYGTASETLTQTRLTG
jgi:hypothetical protein